MWCNCRKIKKKEESSYKSWDELMALGSAEDIAEELNKDPMGYAGALNAQGHCIIIQTPDEGDVGDIQPGTKIFELAETAPTGVITYDDVMDGKINPEDVVIYVDDGHILIMYSHPHPEGRLVPLDTRLVREGG